MTLVSEDTDDYDDADDPVKLDDPDGHDDSDDLVETYAEAQSSSRPPDRHHCAVGG